MADVFSFQGTTVPFENIDAIFKILNPNEYLFQAAGRGCNFQSYLTVVLCTANNSIKLTEETSGSWDARIF